MSITALVYSFCCDSCVVCYVLCVLTLWCVCIRAVVYQPCPTMAKIWIIPCTYLWLPDQRLFHAHIAHSPFTLPRYVNLHFRNIASCFRLSWTGFKQYSLWNAAGLSCEQYAISRSVYCNDIIPYEQVDIGIRYFWRDATRYCYIVTAAGKQVDCSLTSPSVDLKTLCQGLRQSHASSVPQTTRDSWSSVPDSAYHLLKRLLDVNPFTRITAADALEHSFFIDALVWRLLAFASLLYFIARTSTPARPVFARFAGWSVAKHSAPFDKAYKTTWWSLLMAYKHLCYTFKLSSTLLLNFFQCIHYQSARCI